MKDGGHISVFLAMAETEFLPANWEVNASFSIFLFNHIECLSMKNVNNACKHDIKISKFSTTLEFHEGGHNWYQLIIRITSTSFVFIINYVLLCTN